MEEHRLGLGTKTPNDSKERNTGREVIKAKEKREKSREGKNGRRSFESGEVFGLG